MNITVTQADLDAAIAIAKDMGLETIPDALVRGVAGVRIAALDTAVQACQQQASDFLSPEYAVGQPLSSVAERAACAACENAIRSLGAHP